MQGTPAVSNKKHFQIKSSILTYLITFALVIVGIRYFGTIRNDIKLFKQVEPIWLIAAFIAQAGTYFFNATTYQVLLQRYEHNTNLSLKELFQTSIVMLFLNQTIPSVGLSGGTFLLKLLRRKGVSTEGSVFLVLADLLIHYISMIFFAGLVITLVLFLHLPHSYLSILIIGIVAYIILGIFITIAGERKTQVYILSKTKHLGFIGRFFQKYESLIDPKFSDEKKLLKTLTSDRAITLQAVIYDNLLVVCDIFTIYALFLGLGISINPVPVITGYILTQIITLLPISPGSLVVYEGGMSFFFKQLGVPLESAITVTLLYRCLSFWLPIPLGYLFYRKLYKKHLTEH